MGDEHIETKAENNCESRLTIQGDIYDKFDKYVSCDDNMTK